MKKIFIHKLLTFTAFYLYFSVVTIFAKNDELSLPNPMIHIGEAKVSGQIINYHSIKNDSRLVVTIRYMNVITEEENKFECTINAENKFFFDIPIERNVAFVSLNIASEKNNWGWQIIGINQASELNIDINLIDSTSFKIKNTGGVGVDETEMDDAILAYQKFEEQFSGADYYKMGPEMFLDEMLNKDMKNRIKTAVDSLKLSERVRQFVINDFNFEYIQGRIFIYKTLVEYSANSANYSPYYFPFTAKEPDSSFYLFLKCYSLNNPQYLYCFNFSPFIRKFLTIPAFKIKRIENENVDEWLEGVKFSVKKIIGFDNGLFYDLLAAKAYAIQLIDTNKPFSEIQKRNIQDYFGRNNVEIMNVLMRANENLIKHLSNNLQIHELPNVPNDAILDSIIVQYHNHVTLVDFWATWCSPCMLAHTEMQQIKSELKDLGVKFVYFADESSPKTLWKDKIKIIGGNHYYFSSNQWEYLLNSLSFGSIPTYLIYDKKGNLVSKITGFPGASKMKELLINQLDNRVGGK
jgi:thiol-disulfide isomerase/thioredoxin